MTAVTSVVWGIPCIPIVTLVPTHGRPWGRFHAVDETPMLCMFCSGGTVAELELSCGGVLRFASNFFDASTSLIVLLTIF